LTPSCRAILALSCALLLAACAEKWTKPGGSEAEFDAMRVGCESNAYAKFPPYVQQVLVSPGHYNPVQQSCSTVNGVRDCVRFGGDYVPPQYSTIDHNERGRAQDVRACFFAHGWQPVRN